MLSSGEINAYRYEHRSPGWQDALAVPDHHSVARSDIDADAVTMRRGLCCRSGRAMVASTVSGNALGIDFAGFHRVVWSVRLFAVHDRAQMIRSRAQTADKWINSAAYAKEKSTRRPDQLCRPGAGGRRLVWPDRRCAAQCSYRQW